MVLPTNAISASEMLNEPGVAGNGTVTSATLVVAPHPIAARTITIPTSGYVLAMGTAQADIIHTNGTASVSFWGVNNRASAFLDNHALTISIPSVAPGSLNPYRQPVTVQALFGVPAGANTFYFLAAGFGDVRATEVQLTLLFFPTAYGTVTGATGAGEAHAPDEEVFPVSRAELSDGLAESPEQRGGDAVGGERELSGLLAQMEARIASLEQQLANLSLTEGEER